MHFAYLVLENCKIIPIINTMSLKNNIFGKYNVFNKDNYYNNKNYNEVGNK